MGRPSDRSYQAGKKHPSAAFPSSFVVETYIKYVSLLRVSGALHLDIFYWPEENSFSKTPGDMMFLKNGEFPKTIPESRIE
jgi:hypothetical protein